MSYRTHCDWCGEYLAYDDDQAVMPVTIYHRGGGRSVLDARWSEETRVTRHFCASPKEDTDRGGRNRMGLAPVDSLDSCYDRAIAAIKGTKLGDPGMGMEWRLVEIRGDEPSAPAVPIKPAPKIPAPRSMDPTETVSFGGASVTRELYEVILEYVPTSYKYKLPQAGIVSLDQVAAMTDAELLVLKGIGPGIVTALRVAIRERTGYDGLTLAREIFEVLRTGLERIADDDSLHAVLADALPPLAAALGERV